MGIGLLIGVGLGVKEAIGYLTRKKLPTTTPYIQALQKLAKQGIPEEEIDKQLSLLARKEGGIAGITSSKIRQGLAGRGISGVATERAIAEPRLGMQRNIGLASTQLGLESSKIKREAGIRLGLASTELGERRRQEENMARGKLLEGLTGAALTGYGEYRYGKEMEEIDKLIKELLKK